MSCRTTQIVIQFREPPHMLFPSNHGHASNRLVIHIQPAEGMQLQFQTKVPDAGMKMRSTNLEYRFCADFPKAMPEAYERLLLDVLSGDASLFSRSDEVELAWGIIDPIAPGWERPANRNSRSTNRKPGARSSVPNGCTVTAANGWMFARC